MVSSYLKAEREQLLAQIDDLRNAGSIAPPNVHIAPDFLTPKSWMLNGTNLPMQERKLGKTGSPQYKEWVARIQRRDRLHELEQQLALLQGLIDRQQKAVALFQEENPGINVGDWVEFQSQRYRVKDVGAAYLQLECTDGMIIRCKLEQAHLITPVTAQA
ncbi:MAG TPA: hypothetical protein V6D10_05590 [Trichocoleus sp.]|jgi:hypothetical protein